MPQSLALRSQPAPLAAHTDRAAELRQLLQDLAARHAGLAEPVITAVQHTPARPAQFAPMPDWVRPELAAACAAKGVAQLYTHQAAAAERARAGRNVVVVTPTASGKTLCYNLPVLNAVLENPDTRALYLFPTKALAQDQLAELHSLCRALDDRFGVFTYDGDTPADARKAIRQQGHIVLTNPDMLHAGILPHHTRWTRVFENLKYIVLDELHTYRGVFGSHLCNVLRRLKRIARFYGSDPQFICTTATIGNPGELAQSLLEEHVDLIESSGAPAAEKFFVFYNPPVVNRFLGIRRGYLGESYRVAQEFLARDLQTIVFANSRLHTEVLLTYLREASPLPPGAPETIHGYRGGYLPSERRSIERGLREGQIRGVVSTNALELGIDIGSLDAAVMAGYPGTIASAWQRAGRAGRRSGASCAVLVASSSPLDQFIVKHPEYFFGRSPEQAFIQPDNLEILVNHLKCAAFELPIAPDERFGAADTAALCDRLAQAGYLHFTGGHWHWTEEAYPADTISLRAVTSDNFVIIDETPSANPSPRVIGETDFSSALAILHPKAIYLHGAEQYHVERLDFAERKAYVRQVDVDYFTQAIKYTQVRVLDPAAEQAVPGPALRAHGDVLVRSQVVGFKKIKFFTMENVGDGKLQLPENEMHTTACWITLRRPLIESLPFSISDRQDGMSGLLHALQSVASLLLMCDPRDLGTAIGERPPSPGTNRFATAAAEIAEETRNSESRTQDSALHDASGEPHASPFMPHKSPPGPAPTQACHPEPAHEGPYAVNEFFEPNLYLYDAYPGGIGFSEPLYRLHDLLLRKTRELIAACPCEKGCPSCVGAVGEKTERAKSAALAILEALCA